MQYRKGPKGKIYCIVIIQQDPLFRQAIWPQFGVKEAGLPATILEADTCDVCHHLPESPPANNLATIASSSARVVTSPSSLAARTAFRMRPKRGPGFRPRLLR